MKAIRIRTPHCFGCEYLTTQGSLINETRYCTNFKGRKPRRFRAADPKYKVPSWCPKRIDPPMLRVYRLDSMFSLPSDLPKEGERVPDFFSVNESHYCLEREEPSALTARAFYQEVRKTKYIEGVVSHISIGDVIEIDDGLHPYFFYCYDYMTVLEVISFDRKRVGKLRRSVFNDAEMEQDIYG